MTPLLKPQRRSEPRSADSPPPLEPGDLLNRDEFERRYHARPQVKKAELIEGVVHMPSPVRWNQHAVPHADFIGWLVFYRTYTPGVMAGDNGSLRLDMDNEPQADAALIIDPECGGQALLSEDDYIVGAPELVAEVAASSISLDLHAKLRVYRRNQVREYIVWRVQDQQVDWFVLEGSEFRPLAQSEDGLLRSPGFPGLWLDGDALARHDMPRVLQVLQDGIASSEHVQFVERLHSASPPRSAG